MGCCDENSVQVSKMALEIKSGPMLWYKRRFFGNNWRDVHSVSYNDSSFIWYDDKSLRESKGSVVLKDASELISFGTDTSQVPDQPNLPDQYEPKELLAFGVRGTKMMNWFLCPNEEEVTSWMDAISSTLPPPTASPQISPPPQMPASTDPLNSNQDQTLASAYPIEQTTSEYNPGQAAPLYQPQLPLTGCMCTPNQQQMMHQAEEGGCQVEIPAPTAPPNTNQDQTPASAYPIEQTTSEYIPGQAALLDHSQRPPTGSTCTPNEQQMMPQAEGSPGQSVEGGPTTVVQQDRPGYVAGGGKGEKGEFAMGVLLSAAWVDHHHHNYGMGSNFWGGNSGGGDFGGGNSGGGDFGGGDCGGGDFGGGDCGD